jgi:hypothetical protein
MSSPKALFISATILFSLESVVIILLPPIRVILGFLVDKKCLVKA